MSLPGKLCIGVIEEDNPLRAYFRFKPLLVASEGRYEPYASDYPDEGCIRVVPDKNESFHFKTRMREMGLFCAVDLRAHPDDNDKIRPNKNYREGSQEKNAFIIYSDVVKAPDPDSIFEILSPESAKAPLAAPRTARVLTDGAAGAAIYRWQPLPDDAVLGRLTPTEDALPEAQTFELETFGGQRVRFAILPPAPAAEHKPEQKPENKPEHKPEQKPEIKPEQKPEQKPEPVPEVIPEAVSEPKPEPEAKAEPAPEPEPESGEKPWIHRDSSMLPRPVDPRLSPAQRSLAIQSGINPRRGRSLQELIDEKWQRSRLNQLGQPIAPIHTDAPVANPVQGAVEAVRQVWEDPGLRKDLLESLGGLEEFGPSLQACREAARQSGIESHLEALEARRLSLLGELDHLSLKNEEVRRSLKQQLLSEKDAEVNEAARRAREANQERERCEAQAEQARAAARDARTALESLTTEALEQRLTDFALNQHMVERMAQLKGQAEAAPPAMPALQTLDLNALAVRVMNRFDASGFAITRAEALNLCACAALSPVLILSGPVGSGKTETARMLAEALGWTTANRWVIFEPGAETLAEDARVKALAALPQAPAMLLLDDANLYPAPDALRGLDGRLAPRWRLCLTVQDDGFPLSARALDRGFTVRLTPKAAVPWRPRPRATCAPEAPAVLKVAASEAPLPAAAETRMDALRSGLNRCGATPSRRALDDAWRYCALMLAALGDNADPVALLDRAVAQRLLPALLASAPARALAALPALLEGLPVSQALLGQPLPVEV